MTQQMVLITAEQERVLKELQTATTKERILIRHTRNDWAPATRKVLSNLSVDDLAVILYGVGYEVRKTPEEETLQRFEHSMRSSCNISKDDKCYWSGYRAGIADMLRIHGINVKGINAI